MLFVDIKAHQWGMFDPQTVAIELHDGCESGDDDLLDLAAVQTLLHRGTVFSVHAEQVPGRESIAAVFRY